MKGIVYAEVVCFNYCFIMGLSLNYIIAERLLQSETKTNDIWETICIEGA